MNNLVKMLFLNAPKFHSAHFYHNKTIYLSSVIDIKSSECSGADLDL